MPREPTGSADAGELPPRTWSSRTWLMRPRCLSRHRSSRCPQPPIRGGACTVCTGCRSWSRSTPTTPGVGGAGCNAVPAVAAAVTQAPNIARHVLPGVDQGTMWSTVSVPGCQTFRRAGFWWPSEASPLAAIGCPMTATTECGRRAGRSSTTSLPHPALGDSLETQDGGRTSTTPLGSTPSAAAKVGSSEPANPPSSSAARADSCDEPTDCPFATAA